MRALGARLPSALFIAGASALFSGVALLVHIVAGTSLLVTLTLAAGTISASSAILWLRATRRIRAALAKRLQVGAVSGLVATAAYDLARFTLSRGEAFPYDPFDTIRVFGTLLVGTDAPSTLVHAAGGAYHLFNGVAFAISYCLIFRPRLVSALLWGLALEAFQLALYPGWLDIRTFSEFARLSALSHVAYGLTLGAVARRSLGSAPIAVM